MNYLTFLESQNKKFPSFFYERQEKARQNQTIVDEKDKRIADLEKQISLRDDVLEEEYALTKLLAQEWQDMKKERDMWKAQVANQDEAIQKYQEKISDLEAWNEMLTETGHWIGQEEAFDLKMEVEEFLAGMRWENAWTASSESINRLRSSLNNCGPFKSYSLSKGLEKQP